MLALNEELQKNGIRTYIWFIQVGYLQFEKISAFLLEKSSAELLISTHWNILIRVVKVVDKGVIGVEALKRR